MEPLSMLEASTIVDGFNYPSAHFCLAIYKFSTRSGLTGRTVAADEVQLIEYTTIRLKWVILAFSTPVSCRGKQQHD